MLKVTWSCIVITLVFASAVEAKADWIETALHRFDFTDGAIPLGGLLLDADGTLFGTTYGGGNSPTNECPGCGEVFEVLPPTAGAKGWTKTILHHFGNNRYVDGRRPQASLIMDTAGNLYGTTSNGADSNTNARCGDGCGVVFELSPPTAGGNSWTKTILHHFHDFQDGSDPIAQLVMDPAGNLYGTTHAGGNSKTKLATGVLFKLSPPAVGQTAWTETVLFRFTAGSGTYPVGGVILDSAGNLYGETGAGGSFGGGTIYRLSPPAAGHTTWALTVLYSFPSQVNNQSPYGGLAFDTAGNIYGTTQTGGTSNKGSVFELSLPPAGQTNWTYSTLYSFGGSPNNDGSLPSGALIFDAAGNLYGTTEFGGTLNQGTVFELSPPTPGGSAWAETMLHRFRGGTDGSAPADGVIRAADGTLYGATANGGKISKICGVGCGTVFSLTPP